MPIGSPWSFVRASASILSVGTHRMNAEKREREREGEGKRERERERGRERERARADTFSDYGYIY